MSGKYHQLGAILFADIVGYTAMMQQDENAAVENVNRFRETVEIIADELNGKIIQYYGDGCLLLFNSSTDAVEFAKLLQNDLVEAPGIPVRIGIHMGEVFMQGGNIFGDVVNIASRLQAMAPPGCIYISEIVYRNIANKKEMGSVFVKEEMLKNVKIPVNIYEVLTESSHLFALPDAIADKVTNAAVANSIAVLPFANLSVHQEQEYFSDGLTEDIIAQLSKIKAYKVISRTSVTRYKNSSKSVKEIGKELGVKLILEGSVQRSGDKVRITAQLINAISDEHLWADSYDRPGNDIFSIQREVALSIASVLNTSLSKKESQHLDYIPTVNLQAYDFYLRGKMLLENRNKPDLLVARELFQRAVNNDNFFANGYSGLADTYLLSSFRGYENPVQMLWFAKKNIDIALGLDSFSGETQASLGYWYYQNFDLHAAEMTYRRSIGLNASQSNVYLWLAILLEAKGEHEEALKIYCQGGEVNPMWEYLQENKVRVMANKDEMEQAILLQKNLIEKAVHDNKQQRDRYSDLSRLYWSFNEKEEAVKAAKSAGNMGLLKFYTSEDNSILLGEVDKFYKEMQGKSEYVSQLWMGVDYAFAGERETALNCFENAIALKEPAITFLLMHDYQFLNIKYLSIALIIRKVRQLINF
jgi:TolB-like protein/class 3 adenylate cyclase